MKVTALAPWFGSKRTMAEKIIDTLGPHKSYWEPFCGSMAVLLSKPICRLETVNDLHGDLINLARVVRDDAASVELYHRARLVFCSDEELNLADDVIRNSEAGDDVCVDRALAYLITSWMGRNGECGLAHKERAKSLCVRWSNNGGGPGTRWHSAVRSIAAWHRRLRQVIVLRRDGFEVLEKIVDEAGAAIYLDPPYLVKSDRYVHDFESADHNRLAALASRFRKARGRTWRTSAGRSFRGGHMSQLVLSLFPGLGLLDMAFEQEGFTVVRGPDVLWGGDIRRFHPPAGKFDGIIGGPPCQSFSSLVHLVRANGHEPKFGNLIPEYERCVQEAQPAWFLMENVPQAPGPFVDGYDVRPLLLNNAWLPSGLSDGMGQEQERKRVFNFGVRGGPAPNLLRWIDLAVFVLPKAETVTQCAPDNSPEARRRQRPVTASDANFPDNATAAKYQHEAVTGGHDSPPSARKRQKAVTSNVGGFTDGSPHPDSAKAKRLTGSATSSDGSESKRMRRYKLADACRLQGLPADFLADAPFTAEGKLKAVANGVPLSMGLAIARAIREATTGHPDPAA